MPRLAPRRTPDRPRLTPLEDRAVPAGGWLGDLLSSVPAGGSDPGRVSVVQTSTVSAPASADVAVTQSANVTGTDSATTSTDNTLGVSLTVTGPARGVVNTPIPLNVQLTAPADATVTVTGVPAGATLSAGTNANGTWTLTPAQVSGLTLTAPTAGTSTLTVRVRAVSGTSTSEQWATLTVTVDPAGGGGNTGGTTGTGGAAVLVGGELRVTGTAGDDTILVKPAADPTKLEVFLNGTSQGTFDLTAITGRVVVRGLAGNDKITVDPAVTKPTSLYGNMGNDTLGGGSGNDLLAGGWGDDTYLFADGWGADTVREDGFPFSFLAGRDTADFSAVTAGLTVTRGAGTPRVTAGPNSVQVREVERVIGGSGTDTLAALGEGNAWSLTGTGAGGLNGMLQFSGVENLTGGPGWDAFAVSPGAGVSGIIDGAGGLNSLNYRGWTTGVTVNLPLGTATGAGGGVRNVSIVRGGAGNDLIVGNDRDNYLSGEGGNDVLIGGRGNDLLFGGPGDDLILSGVTDYATDPAALSAVQAEWTSGSSYTDRVAHLTGTTGGVNNGKVFNSTTVHGDGGVDIVGGGSGRDWFVTGPGDIHLDMTPDETRTRL